MIKAREKFRAGLFLADEYGVTFCTELKLEQNVSRLGLLGFVKTLLFV